MTQKTSFKKIDVSRVACLHTIQLDAKVHPNLLGLHVVSRGGVVAAVVVEVVVVAGLVVVLLVVLVVVCGCVVPSHFVSSSSQSISPSHTHHRGMQRPSEQPNWFPADKTLHQVSMPILTVWSRQTSDVSLPLVTSSPQPSFLFLPSLEIPSYVVSTDLKKKRVTDGRRDGWTEGQTERLSYRDVWTHLKSMQPK